MIYIVIVGIVCVVLGFVFGMFYGFQVGQNSVKDIASAKVAKLNDMLSDTIRANSTSVIALSTAMALQDKLANTLRKEKRQLATQLETSTEALAELEGLMEDRQEQEEENNSSDEEEGNETAITVIATQAATKKNAVATDKLITLKNILQDAAAKGEEVSPHTLLGIVNFRLE